MSQELRVTWLTVAGVFLITLATLMDEILITRIFSVTMWYHFAFVAISLAMFGMTVGGLRVYQHPNIYGGAGAKRQMASCALWFGVSAVASVLAQLFVPFASHPMFAMFWIILSYVLFSIPFYFSGVCVCVALTKFPGFVSRLYATDLVGAASGCVLLIYVLKITDAPTAVVVVGLLGSLAAALFAADGGLAHLRRTATLLSATFAIIVIVNTALAQKQGSLLRVTWAKYSAEARPLYEKWNSFSRIAVDADPNVATSVITEGISPTYPKDRGIRQLRLKIDADAETTMTAFSGDFDGLDYLRYDVKNIVHYVRPNSSVLIIGAGGGRDVLSALLFEQRAVRAVEINQNILHTVNEIFGNFTGHLDRNPKVTFVNDEARSYISRTDERFDIIEASFIDTWAATAGGALTLTENSLYTIDAWKLFLDRLTSNGVLSFSRWYFPELPAEAYRLTSLAAAALRAEGTTDPRAHILLVRNLRQDTNGRSIGAATILVSKEPFSPAELDRVEAVSKQMQFDMILSPRVALDPIFAELSTRLDVSGVARPLHVNLSPPTDDSPFFFNLTPFRESFHLITFDDNGRVAPHLQSGRVVGFLLLLVTFLTFYCILLPLLRTTRKETLRSAAPHLLFFAVVGLGFMLIEISQMQRLIVFLGHPTYALSVVLFALLLSSGLGSYTTRRIVEPGNDAKVRLVILLMVLLAFGLMTPRAISAFSSSTTGFRIFVATGILFPLGLFMGMAFPLGLKLAASRLDGLTPLFWGMNGATSVCGSVLAVSIAMNAGISSSFWTGFWCYAVAFGSYLWAAQEPAAVPQTNDTTTVTTGPATS